MNNEPNYDYKMEDDDNLDNYYSAEVNIIYNWIQFSAILYLMLTFFLLDGIIMVYC